MRLIFVSLIVTVLVSCAGKNGSDGAQGPKGDNGAAGSSGLTVQSGLFCYKVDTSFGGAPNYQYLSITYTTGDRQISCSTITATGEYTNTVFYKSTQSGATTGSCLASASLSGDSWGYWRYTSQSGTSQTVYNCSGCPSGKNGYTYSFITSDCASF